MARVIRDLPMPGSPASRTTRPSPSLTCVQRRSSSSISSSRPTSGVRADERKAVANVLRDEAFKPAYGGGDALMISPDYLAQVLRIELRRKGSRADEIAEHYREVAAFGARRRRSGGEGGGRGVVGGGGPLEGGPPPPTKNFPSGLLFPHTPPQRQRRHPPPPAPQ